MCLCLWGPWLQGVEKIMGTEQWLHHPSPFHQSHHEWDSEHGPVLFILDWIWTGSQASDESSFLPVWEAQSHDQPQVMTGVLGMCATCTLYNKQPQKGPGLER